VSGAQLARYETWIRALEARQKTLAESRARYLGFFAAAAGASSLGFFWGPWVGAGTFFSGIVFAVFGFYAVRVRERDYERELGEARVMAERLREASRGRA
jgi:hypothetical protein